MSDYCVIKTTFNKKSEAKKIGKMLLEKRLVACVEISTIESSYIWKGKIEKAKEFELSLKTKSTFYKPIEKLILANHSYELPQIIALPFLNISKPYAEWIESCIMKN